MSAAHKIPEVLVDKITLMCYTLTPNPTATMIKDFWAKLVFESCSIIKDSLVEDGEYELGDFEEPDEDEYDSEEDYTDARYRYENANEEEEEILKRCCYSPHLLFTLSQPDKNHYSGEITTELNRNRIMGYYREGFHIKPLYDIENFNLEYWNLLAYYMDNIYYQEN